VGQQDKNFTVILVDTGTDSKLKKLFSTYRRRLRINYFRSSRHNLTYARNLGIRNTVAPLVAFIDDDALASPTWIFSMKQAFDAYPDAVIVGGKTKAYGARYIEKFSELLFDYGGKFQQVPTVAGVNMGVHLARIRRLVGPQRVKLFDESIDIDAGDDTELCYYVSAVGGKVYYDPQCVVFHAQDRGLMAFLKRQIVYAHGDYLAVRKKHDVNNTDEYVSLLQGSLTTLLLPLFLFPVFVRKSIHFVKAGRAIWIPLVLLREIVYVLALWYYALSQGNIPAPHRMS
jgi:glycosyltransferase involved in cell wall biosynthesis